MMSSQIISNDLEKIFKHRNEEMCDKWREVGEGKFPLCNARSIVNQHGNHILKGEFPKGIRMQGVYIQYWAANPADSRLSFSGSGLPFPNEFIAFEGNRNCGAVRMNGREFTFILKNPPNSYYSEMGGKLNPPQVKFQFVDAGGNSIGEIYTMPMGSPIPFRSLRSPLANTGPDFYNNTEMPLCRTQEQILRDSRFPTEARPIPPNFWGSRPPK